MRKFPLEPKTNSSKLMAKKSELKERKYQRLKMFVFFIIFIILFINVGILNYYIINLNQ